MLYNVKLEFHVGRDMIRFVLCKDWLLFGEGLGAGECDSQDTDQLAGPT